VKVNKLSLKQGGGNVEQPTHQMPDGTVMPGETHQQAEEQPVIQPPAQQQDPAIAQISEMVNSALQEGQDPVSIVMALIEQDVDQNIIAQAFITGGYAEEDVVTLFENVQQKSQPPAEASAEEQTKDPQEIARNQSLEEEAALAEAQQAETLAAEQDAMSQNLTAKSGIEIKPENEGKFTKWAKARGMSVSEAYNKVMSNKEKYATNVVQMANFAKNAAGWKKEEGGEQKAYEPHFMYKGDRKIRAKDMATHLRLKEAGYNHDAPKAQEGAEIILEEPQVIQNPIPGMMLNPFVTMEFRDVNQNGIEDREEGIYKDQDYIPIPEGGVGPGPVQMPMRKKTGTGIAFQTGGTTPKSKAQEFYETTGVVQRGDVLTNTAPRYNLPTVLDNGEEFSVSKALSTLADVGQTLFSSDLDENGLKSGTFMDWQKKDAIEEATKGNYYNYEVTNDPNDPTAYADDNLGLFNASKTFGKNNLRTADQYTEDFLENSMANYNEETKEYDITKSSRKINPNLPGINQNSLKGENLNYFKSVDDATRQEILDFGSSDSPEGTTLGIDEKGATGYYSPDAENPYEYNTMMGKNKYGVNTTPIIPLEEQKTELTSMIQPNEQGMFKKPSIVSAEKDLSFKEWSMQDSFNRTGANAPQQYQDYLNGVETETTIESDKPNLQDRIEGGLNEAGEFIEGKYNQVAPVVRKGIDDAGMFVKDKVNSGLEYLENKFEEGGDLPKAQVGTGMFDFDFTPYFDEEQQAGQENYFANLGSGQTNYMEDTQNVADAQLLKENPGLGPTPQQQETNAMFTPQAKLNTTPFADPADLVDPAVAVEEEDELFKGPQVKRTNKLQGGIDRFLDSKEVGVFKDVSTAAVQVAGVANDFFRQRGVNEAVANNRANLTADEVYGTNEDPFMKRGAWDINTGTFGSEGQRTVRTNMGIAKDGGGINNAGFKALPPQAQQNILDNMLYGGDPNPGITALRKVAPQVVSKMGYKGGGETINVNSTILAKLIAAGADIEIL
tara:strand:- start:1061 stop:4084 length:3024 start_codon:yes stop_codon:yes gene_type:complete